MRDPKLTAEIAKQLNKFHQVQIPGSKEPQLWIDMLKFFEKGFSLLLYEWFVHAFFYFPFELVVVFHFLASALSFDDDEKDKKYRTISFEEVHNEIDKLKVRLLFCFHMLFTKFSHSAICTSINHITIQELNSILFNHCIFCRNRKWQIVWILLLYLHIMICFVET